jgi:hypothetical protein
MDSTALRLINVAVLLISMSVLSVVLWHHPAAEGQDAKRYVYKVVDVPPDNSAMQATLNEYGAAGWELILIGMGDMTTPRLVFKK